MRDTERNEILRVGRGPDQRFEDGEMYPAKMAGLVFGHIMFLTVLVWIFR
jgi:hypothetical protein